MKAKFAVPIVIALALVFCNLFPWQSGGIAPISAWAASPTPHPYINAASANLSPVPVGTSTPVLLLYGRPRCSWTITWTGAGNLWCAPIPATGNPFGTGATTPDFTPSNGVGFEFASAQAPWTSGGSLVADPSIGLECVSDSGTLNVSTWEFMHCYGQRMGMP